MELLSVIGMVLIWTGIILFAGSIVLGIVIASGTLRDPVKAATCTKIGEFLWDTPLYPFFVGGLLMLIVHSAHTEYFNAFVYFIFLVICSAGFLRKKKKSKKLSETM